MLEKMGECKCFQWRGITQSFAMLLFDIFSHKEIELKRVTVAKINTYYHHKAEF